MAALTQINMYNTVINNTTNNITIYNGAQVDFYADFTNDELVVFPESNHLNELFIGSLQGTDTMLSRFTTEYFKDRFHCTSGKKWYQYEGHCWNEDAADLAYREAMGEDAFLDHYRRVALHFESLPIQNDETKRKARMIRKLCVQLEDGKQREKIASDSIMKFHKRRPRFATDLNTQNIMIFEDGVLNFEDFSFAPGHPDTPVTMHVDQPFIPFDPEHPSVIFLLQFMAEILPDPAVREYTLKIPGLSLTMDTSQQYFFVWTGSGGNGKGRLLSLMEQCLGVYFQSIPPTFLTRKREDANQANEALMSLRCVRLAVFQEAEATDVLQAGTIKSITGEDTLSSRENYGRQVKFKPSFKSLFVCNEIPQVSESTGGFWRRFRVAHFPTSFVENPTQPHERKADSSLDQKLREAAPYFIGILIHYLKKYRVEGLAHPPAVQSATNRYKDSVDKVKEFVTEHMCRSEDENDILEWPAFYKAFKDAYPSAKMKRPELRTELLKHGVVYKDTSLNGKKFYGFLGWQLK